VFTKTYASNRRSAKGRRGFVDYRHEGGLRARQGAADAQAEIAWLEREIAA